MTYVAFLRAINVGGRSVVKMDDLRDVFTDAGCQGVRTYIASGNVVFDATAARVPAAMRKVQSTLRRLLEVEAGIFCRTANEIDQLLEADPFKRFSDELGLKLYVALLSHTPRTAPKLPLLSTKELLEVIAVEGREAFIVSRRKKNGFYGFPNNFIEEELGVSATSRNWSTITKLAEFIRREP